MNILYFDCFAGISGDMTLGAMLDLGVPLDHLRQELAKLPLPEGSYSLSLKRTTRKGISAAHLAVEITDTSTHRHFSHISDMITASTLDASVKNRAIAIFTRLAEAEAKVHGVPIEKVHFHEVGAVDSIVDIVGTAICYEYLGIDASCAGPLPLGSGCVETAHGLLPVPAPATAELLTGLPVHGKLGEGERVTPTGAAIVSSLCSEFGSLPAMTITKIGSGAGTREFPDVPNILRLVMGTKDDTLCRDEIVVLETHIDDMNPEITGFVMERLLAAGALDVAFSPLQMKKNRPGIRLTVIAPQELRPTLARLILTETTAAGVRYHTAERTVLDRRNEVRQTSLGPVSVKIFSAGGSVLRAAPEFEECRQLAEKHGIPLQQAYAIVEKEACAL